MNQHPAIGLARSAASYAEELRSCMNSADPFPWPLTEDDYLDVMRHLDRAVSALADCAESAAESADDDQAYQLLAEAAGSLRQGHAHISDAALTFRMANDQESGFEDDDQDDRELADLAPPVQLAAASFPAPMTTGMLQRTSAARARPQDADARSSARTPMSGPASARSRRT